MMTLTADVGIPGEQPPVVWLSAFTDGRRQRTGYQLHDCQSRSESARCSQATLAAACGGRRIAAKR